MPLLAPLGNTPCHVPPHQENALPPRKKTTQVEAIKTRVAEAANAVHELAAKDTLAHKIAGLEEGLTGKIVLLKAQVTSLEDALSAHMSRSENLFVTAAARMGEDEKALAELQERIRAHEVSGATRRASIAARIQGLESAASNAAKELARLGAEETTSPDAPTSQALRSLWLGLAGLAVAVGIVGVKTFAG